MENQLRREILRYAGMGRAAENEVDQRILDFIERAVGELRAACRPRFTSKTFSLHFVSDAKDCGHSALLFGDNLEVHSKSLSVNLADCQQAVFMAATLGSEADRLISRYSIRDISQGVLMEAAATALIEEFCDDCQRKLEESWNEKSMTLRPRFSPGYGDFDISHQKDMVLYLDLPRQIGVTLTDGGMLAPSKSVTAIMGIARLDDKAEGTGKVQRARCHIHGCEVCKKTDCIYRRNS